MRPALLILYALAIMITSLCIYLILTKQRTLRYHALTDTPALPDTGGIHHNALTQADKANYQLNITLGKQKHNPCLSGQNNYTVNARLHNLSGDTLKFLEYSCSSDILSTSQNSVLIMAALQAASCGVCEKNSLELRVIPPGQSRNFEACIYPGYNGALAGVKLRVGMIIQRVLTPGDFTYYIDSFSRFSNLQDQTKNRIWSNSIAIP